jgi:chaperonin GroEL
MNKKTLYGTEARAKILDGIKKISAAVKCTLGPLGRNVMISQSMIVDYGVHSLPIMVTKDGYRTAICFDLDDPFEKGGVLLVKEACQKTVDQAGDGTTTTAVLLEAIVEEGIKLIQEGANPMELKRGIDKAVEHVVEEFKKAAVKIGNDNEKIFQIATISANNDPEIGRLIADAFKKIGAEGIIDIEAGKSVKTEIKIAEGYKWQYDNWISPLFINKPEKQICEFEEPLILLYHGRITHHTQVKRALEITMKEGRPLLIVCEDASEEGLAFLAMNNIQKRIQVCVIKSPGFGEDRRLEMEDIALVTGGSYISEARGLNIKEVELVNLGQARKVIVNKEETVIIGGIHDGEGLEKLLGNLRMDLTRAKNEDERFPIEKRIAKLTGGVAVIQVGAATETEMKERLDRFDDAVRATKSAISEGYVPGGGLSFLNILMVIDLDSPLSKGMQIIANIKTSILQQICKNAGVEYEQKAVQISSERIKSKSLNVGYNAKTDKIEDLVEAGVIDPVKVLRCALQNAASSASMALTTECLICDTM